MSHVLGTNNTASWVNTASGVPIGTQRIHEAARLQMLQAASMIRKNKK